MVVVAVVVVGTVVQQPCVFSGRQVNGRISAVSGAYGSWVLLCVFLVAASAPSLETHASSHFPGPTGIPFVCSLSRAPTSLRRGSWRFPLRPPQRPPEETLPGRARGTLYASTNAHSDKDRFTPSRNR